MTTDFVRQQVLRIEGKILKDLEKRDPRNLHSYFSGLVGGGFDVRAVRTAFWNLLFAQKVNFVNGKFTLNSTDKPEGQEDKDTPRFPDGEPYGDEEAVEDEPYSPHNTVNS
jgi:hypothetical protein